MEEVVLSETYGTRDCASLIFNKDGVDGPFDNETFNFISRLLCSLPSPNKFTTSHLPCPLKESKATYSSAMIWPLLQNSARTLPGLTCDFKVGETLLKALNHEGIPNYNADDSRGIKDVVTFFWLVKLTS